MKTPEEIRFVEFESTLSDSTLESMRAAIKRQRDFRNERERIRREAAEENRKIREGLKA